MKWIKCSDKKPRKGTKVLCLIDDGSMYVLDFNNNRYETDHYCSKWNDVVYFDSEDVTHWMPLPEPPEDKK